jgi:cell division protein ZapA
MGSIEVIILGQRYTIKGDADEEYIKKLADYVDTKMKEVIEAAPNTSPLKASILAALNIADELHKIDKTEADLNKLEEKANALTGLLD